jgi:hypothetical protein
MDTTMTAAATAAAACAAAYCVYQAAGSKSRRSLELRTAHAALKVDLSGGSLASFTAAGAAGTNPISWDCATHDGLDVDDVKPRPLGHFLCCDRWGPPTPAELENGMFYHGEAPQVEWQVSASAESSATVGCDMPMAGMTIQRSVEMAPGAAVAVIKETVRNVGVLCRMYNCVQHPSIAAPFLNAATVIDCNGKRGFAQGDNTNTCAEHPEQPTFEFPATINRAGAPADARTMTGGDDDVQSYEVDPASELGWVTATDPSSGLVFGYCWKRADYPWISLWCCSRDDGYMSRGIEFGTTGLHKPFPMLAKHPTLFGLPTFLTLDAQESQTRGYAMFLAEVPEQYAGQVTGVSNVTMDGAQLTLTLERGADQKPATVNLRTAGVAL